MLLALLMHKAFVPFVCQFDLFIFIEFSNSRQGKARVNLVNLLETIYNTKLCQEAASPKETTSNNKLMRPTNQHTPA